MNIDNYKYKMLAEKNKSLHLKQHTNKITRLISLKEIFFILTLINCILS